MKLQFNSIKVKIIILICLMCILIITYATYVTKQLKHKTVSFYSIESTEKTQKTVLLWTNFFESKMWLLPETDPLNGEYLKSVNCPVTNCLITLNRNYLNITQFDAVLFHGIESFEKPLDRSDHQLYVFGLLESPPHSRSHLANHDNFFNLTMTYRLNSDIVWAYGYVSDVETGKIYAPTISPAWKVAPVFLDNDDNLRILIEGKTKLGAWFVSNCDAPSKRNKLVKSLQNYINIDVYGNCGKFKCPRDSAECDILLDKEYKFYFSLENSLCRDYVTEKLFNALKRQIVPVVFGGADYKRFAPPHSYIDANNFETAEELASYLQYLDSNPQEYMKYFWWKKYYTVSERTFFCDLCLRLNEPVRTEKIQVYRNIESWWYRNSCTIEPKIKF